MQLTPSHSTDLANANPSTRTRHRLSQWRIWGCAAPAPGGRKETSPCTVQPALPCQWVPHSPLQQPPGACVSGRCSRCDGPTAGQSLGTKAWAEPAALLGLARALPLALP